MVVSGTMTNSELIQITIKNNGGYITRRDINKLGIPSAILSRYVKENGLIRHCIGFYSEKNWITDDFLVFQYQYPKFVYSWYSAAYLNGLGDFLPPFLEVTGPKNYRPFEFPKNGIILHTDSRDDIYQLGIIKVNTPFSNKVRCYDLEKTVCDFIRNRNKIENESFVKCINWYNNRNDKNINKLMKYAKAMKIENKVNSIMELILNND